MAVTPDDVWTWLIEWGWKIVGGFITFLSGVVSATWIVAGKVKGFETRLQAVEESQQKCQGVTLAKLDAKLDHIRDRIEDFMMSQIGGKNDQDRDQ